MIRSLLLACLLAVGVGQIAGATGTHVKAWLGQALLERAWSRAGRSDEPEMPWPGAVSHPIARIEVPALNVDRLVLKGAETPVLAWGPGMEVGPKGHRLIAAHRDTHFNFLKDLKGGDRVKLALADGRIEHWAVAQRSVVDSRRFGLNLAASGDRMSWVTCWPFNAIEPGGPLRLLVTLHRTSSPDDEQAGRGLEL